MGVLDSLLILVICAAPATRQAFASGDLFLFRIFGDGYPLDIDHGHYRLDEQGSASVVHAPCCDISDAAWSGCRDWNADR